MLIITIQNDKSGTLDSRNYDYSVYINTHKLAKGRIEAHDPVKGWQGLIRQLAEDVHNATPVDELDYRIQQLTNKLDDTNRLLQDLKIAADQWEP